MTVITIEDRERDQKERQRQQAEAERHIWIDFLLSYDKPVKPREGLRKSQDLIGERFGKLVAIGHVPGEATCSDGLRWRCRCICGGAREAWGAALVRGTAVDCGCRARWSKLRRRARRRKESRDFKRRLAARGKNVTRQ
jgi:hypothetical protein